MKPAVCIICDRSGSQIEGDWVEFSNYKPLASGEIGHPKGLEWFCRNHLEAAKSVANRTCEDGIIYLKNEFGEFEAQHSSRKEKKSMIRRIIGIFKK